MQDVDYIIEYVPGKDDKDPLDYLSRHPLEATEDAEDEHSIKWMVQQDHAILMKDIQKATDEDEEIQKILQITRHGRWEKHKKDPEVMPYYNVRDELYEVDGLLMRDHKIVLPRKLRKKTVSIAHHMGHLGKSKTKERIRGKYWFPELGTMVDQINCFDCAVATRERRQEPIKPSEIPREAWHTIAVDYGGAYPDGHYNLVMIDKRSRYPVVEEVSNTEFEQARVAFKKVFATYGTPVCIESDGGPPFNSTEFARFANIEGFEHHVVTPDHARANGMVERFMQPLNKTERIVARKTKNKNERKAAIQEMLIAYRDTPHPATGITPYRAMENRHIRTRLEAVPGRPISEEEVTKNDENYKVKMKNQKTKRNMKEHNLIRGDCVLVEQKKHNKWTLPYEPSLYTVIDVKGSTVTARRLYDGRTITRDGSKFKIANQLMEEENMASRDSDEAQEDEPEEPDDDLWREQVMRDTQPIEPEPMRLDEGTPAPPVVPDVPLTPEIPATPKRPPTPARPNMGTCRRRTHP